MQRLQQNGRSHARVCTFLGHRDGLRLSVRVVQDKREDICKKEEAVPEYVLCRVSRYRGNIHLMRIYWGYQSGSHARVCTFLGHRDSLWLSVRAMQDKREDICKKEEAVPEYVLCRASPYRGKIHLMRIYWGYQSGSQRAWLFINVLRLTIFRSMVGQHKTS